MQKRRHIPRQPLQLLRECLHVEILRDSRASEMGSRFEGSPSPSGSLPATIFHLGIVNSFPHSVSDLAGKQVGCIFPVQELYLSEAVPETEGGGENGN